MSTLFRIPCFGWLGRRLEGEYSVFDSTMSAKVGNGIDLPELKAVVPAAVPEENDVVQRVMMFWAPFST